MLAKIDNFNKHLSRWFEFVGIFGMVVMMLITCIDVVGAKLFKAPLLGALDIVMLAQIVTISFGAGMTLYLKRHIEVEFFFDFLPPAVRNIVTRIVLMICLIFFIKSLNQKKLCSLAGKPDGYIG